MAAGAVAGLFPRLVIGQLLTLVRRYPALVDGAFVIIAWVGTKLCIEYLHAAHFVSFEIPQWLSLGLIVVIFTVAFIYARMQGPVPDEELPSEEMDEEVNSSRRA